MRVSRLAVHEVLQPLGWPGLAGLLCLLLALGYAMFGLLPSWQQLQSLEQQLQLGAERAQRIADGLEAPVIRIVQPFDELHRTLPAQLEATTAIDRIYVLAGQQNIALESGEYSLGIDPKTRLARYQIILPVRGSYPQLRRFLHSLLGEMPGLVLEDVDVQRKNISDRELNGRLRMTLYLSRRS
ncbi:MAG: GspMb/PilO family protein [Pseudomonas sp.]